MVADFKHLTPFLDAGSASINHGLEAISAGHGVGSKTVDDASTDDSGDGIEVSHDNQIKAETANLAD